MIPTRIVTGHHQGLFDLIATSINLIEERDDELPRVQDLDSVDALEYLLIHLPGYADSISPLALYPCVAFLKDELAMTDLGEWMFSVDAYKLDLAEDYYTLYLRAPTCN